MGNELTLVVFRLLDLSLIRLLQTRILCLLRVFHSRGHHRMLLPVELGTHHLHLGLLQVIRGRNHHQEHGAVPGLVKDGLIRVSPKVNQKDQDPTDGPRMTRRGRTDDGKSDQQ